MQTTGHRVVLVTGASSGIGRAAALALAEAGLIVYATARRPEALGDLAARGLRTLRLDVTDEASMAAAVYTIEQDHGAIDVLINNAGFGVIGPVEEVGPEEWRRQFETNVFGLVRLTQLALPAMRARGRGRVINISSMGGEFTFPLAGAYHASKYAIEALSDALRFELRPFGIQVVVVQPGPVRTALADAAVEALQPRLGSPYTALIESYSTQTRASYEQGGLLLAPEAVARVIVAAATVRQPRTRYKVGTMAHAMPLLRHLLPDRLWDALLWRLLGPRRRASTLATS